VSGLLTVAEYMTDSCRVKAIVASLTGIYAPEAVKTSVSQLKGGDSPSRPRLDEQSSYSLIHRTCLGYGWRRRSAKLGRYRPPALDPLAAAAIGPHRPKEAAEPSVGGPKRACPLPSPGVLIRKAILPAARCPWVSR